MQCKMKSIQKNILYIWKRSDYFCQIELSKAVEDDKYIYIIKNITKLAGNGAISRLNNGLGKDRDRKHQRREELVNRLNADVISYNNNDWIMHI